MAASASAYMGDGAVNQGQVYESFNMAALWKLPVIYVIENNRYGMGTPGQRAAAGKRLCDRGEAYGIPGQQVDGMDVRGGARQGRGAGRAMSAPGNGPVILEAMTYRYRGHSMSDPAKYRTKEEVQEMRERHDPIERPAQGDRSIGAAATRTSSSGSTRRSATSSTRRRGSRRTRPEPDPQRALDRHPGRGLSLSEPSSS